jgi:hypothetical protein
MKAGIKSIYEGGIHREKVEELKRHAAEFATSITPSKRKQHP